MGIRGIYICDFPSSVNHKDGSGSPYQIMTGHIFLYQKRKEAKRNANDKS